MIGNTSKNQQEFQTSNIETHDDDSHGPYNFFGYDDDGKPIVYELLGKLDNPKLDNKEKFQRILIKRVPPEDITMEMITKEEYEKAKIGEAPAGDILVREEGSGDDEEHGADKEVRNE